MLANVQEVANQVDMGKKFLEDLMDECDGDTYKAWVMFADIILHRELLEMLDHFGISYDSTKGKRCAITFHVQPAQKVEVIRHDTQN